MTNIKCYFNDLNDFNVTKKTFTTDDIDAPNNTAANVTATNTANNNAFGDKKLFFKNNAPFINCILKINSVKIDNAEDLDVLLYLSTVKITKKQQVVYGITIEMNQVVL